MASEPARVKSWIWSGWLGCSFLLWICPLSLRRCRHLFGVPRQFDVKSQEEHLMHGTDRWGKPGVLPSHNNLSETAGPYTSSEKWKLPADSTASFVCVTSTCWHASGTALFPRSSVFICIRFFLGNKTHYCVHNSAFCCTDMHQDKHVIHILMIHFAQLSLRLSAFLSPSLLPAAASLLSSVFQPPEVSEATVQAPVCWHLSSTTTFRSVFYVYVCMCVTERERNERVSVSKR